MMANCYKDRVIAEYKQLCDRISKLHTMITKYRAGSLDYDPDCPINILMDQERAMIEYRNILEIRAEIEDIDLR